MAKGEDAFPEDGDASNFEPIDPGTKIPQVSVPVVHYPDHHPDSGVYRQHPSSPKTLMGKK